MTRRILAFSSNGELTVPSPNKDGSFSAYVRAELFHPKGNQEWKSKAVKVKNTAAVGADIMWNGQFQWEYESEELAFIRFVSGSIWECTI